MKEVVLRQFFEGHATAAELDADATGMLIQDGPAGGPYVYRYRVLPMERTMELEPQHLIQLLDATSAGQLGVYNLEAICSWLEGACERFLRDVDTPDGERVGEALFWLGNPDINYPLTPAVLSKIRHYLATGENTLSRADTRVRAR